MLKIKPIFVEKVWGGNKLSSFGFELPNSKIGEAWLVSGYKNRETKISNHSLNLQQYYQKYPKEFNNYPTKDFPLLIKLIDAREDLSIQVHPDNNSAQKLEDYPFGKNECWYVINHDKNSKIIVGEKTADKKKLKNLIIRGKWDDVYNIINSKKNLSLNINAGTVHSIGKGNLIYELQQSSNITYRLYDFDRLEKGVKRKLDIEKAIKCIKKSNNIFQNPTSLIKKNNFKSELIIKNNYFNLEEWTTIDDYILKINPKKYFFLVITNLESPTYINDSLINKGESIILTSSDLKKEIVLKSGKLLVAYPK